MEGLGAAGMGGRGVGGGVTMKSNNEKVEETYRVVPGRVSYTAIQCHVYGLDVIR